MVRPSHQWRSNGGTGSLHLDRGGARGSAPRSDRGAGSRCCYRGNSGRARNPRSFDGGAKIVSVPAEAAVGPEVASVPAEAVVEREVTSVPAEEAVEALDVDISLMCLLCLDVRFRRR